MNLKDIIARAEAQRKTDIEALESEGLILEPQRGSVVGYKATIAGETFLVARFTPAGEAGYSMWGFYESPVTSGKRIYESLGDITTALINFRCFYLLPRREVNGKQNAYTASQTNRGDFAVIGQNPDAVIARYETREAAQQFADQWPARLQKSREDASERVRQHERFADSVGHTTEFANKWITERNAALEALWLPESRRLPRSVTSSQEMELIRLSRSFRHAANAEYDALMEKFATLVKSLGDPIWEADRMLWSSLVEHDEPLYRAATARITELLGGQL